MKHSMIIAVSGTPGTGKTEACRILARKMKARLITVRGLIRKKALGYGYDRKRRTKIIDEHELEKAVKKAATGRINIVESHLSHLIRADIVFVLRTNPAELEKRLVKRRWPEKKIRENVEAEMLDQITAEALQKNRAVYEIDTSKLDPERTSSIMLKVLNNLDYGKKYAAGMIDWTRKYGKKYFARR